MVSWQSGYIEEFLDEKFIIFSPPKLNVERGIEDNGKEGGKTLISWLRQGKCFSHSIFSKFVFISL